MVLVFKNTSKSRLRLHIDGKHQSTMLPYEEKSINLDLPNGELHISIFPDKKSTIKNDLYHIVLNTSYFCSAIQNNAQFVITREKIRFAYNAFYERLFINSSGATCTVKEITPVDEKNLRSQFQRNKIKKFFLSGPFEDFLALPLFLVIIGIVLLISFGWKIALIYTIFAYAFLVLLNSVIKFFLKTILNKRFSFDEDKEFCEYLQPNYILQYYASEDRKPFLGKKKWLETE